MYRLPTDSDRHVIIGATGSGKTVAAAHALSLRNFDKMPWGIVNSKSDKLLNKIPGVQRVGMDYLPKKPGLYMYEPVPERDDEMVNELMRRVWQRQRMGLFFDEGYMIPQPSGPFNALLTQGRSRNCPLIICTQRPVWLSKFIWSEASFFQCFRLQEDDDVKLMQKRMKMTLARLPDYNSYWYDVGNNYRAQLTPVPNEDEILAEFDARRVDGEIPITYL